MHFRHCMIGKHFTETSNKVEFRINHVLINCTRPVVEMSVEGNNVTSADYSSWCRNECHYSV